MSNYVDVSADRHIYKNVEPGNGLNQINVIQKSATCFCGVTTAHILAHQSSDTQMLYV